MPPTVDEELALWRVGCRRIAGLDEAGRGCWAGPVVAAAVVLPAAVLFQPQLLAGVDDSKVLTARQREQLFERIVQVADWGVGVVPAYMIDVYGIVSATRLAMQVALLRLRWSFDALVIDAVRLDGWSCPQQVFVRGDSRCLGIAAASIVAKVTRDRLMVGLAQCQPDYGFAQHKGYGTALHYRFLRAYGPSSQHRRSFRPLADFLTNGVWSDDVV